MPVAPSLDKTGVFCRTALDCGLVAASLQGHFHDVAAAATAAVAASVPDAAGAVIAGAAMAGGGGSSSGRSGCSNSSCSDYYLPFPLDPPDSLPAGQSPSCNSRRCGSISIDGILHHSRNLTLGYLSGVKDEVLDVLRGMGIRLVGPLMDPDLEGES